MENSVGFKGKLRFEHTVTKGGVGKQHSLLGMEREGDRVIVVFKQDMGKMTALVQRWAYLCSWSRLSHFFSRCSSDMTSFIALTPVL